MSISDGQIVMGDRYIVLIGRQSILSVETVQVIFDFSLLSMQKSHSLLVSLFRNIVRVCFFRHDAVYAV